MFLSVMKLKIIYYGIFLTYTSFPLIVISAVNFMYSFNLSVSWGAFQTNLGEHQPASAMVVYSPNRHTSHHRILADEASQELLRGQETCIVFRVLICIGFINYFSKIYPLKSLKKHLVWETVFALNKEFFFESSGNYTDENIVQKHVIKLVYCYSQIHIEWNIRKQSREYKQLYFNSLSESGMFYPILWYFSLWGESFFFHRYEITCHIY